MPLSHITGNSLVDTNFLNCKKNIKYIMHMDDTKLFAKNEKGNHHTGSENIERLVSP